VEKCTLRAKDTCKKRLLKGRLERTGWLGAGLLFGDVGGGWDGEMIGAGRDYIEIFSERT
jgi:hypothetical protein